MPEPETHDVSVFSHVLDETMHALALVPDAPPTGPRRWLWLLHGRGSSAARTHPLLAVLGQAMAQRLLAPHVVVAPDGPWSDRASWWVDSTFTGAAAGGPPAGRPVETALLTDLLPALEQRFGGPTSAWHRLIGGVSMGGAAALRYVLVHDDLFGGAALLTPAAYPRDAPSGSSARTSGAFGSGSHVFDASRFGELMSYVSLLARRSVDAPQLRVAVVAGDREPAQDVDGEPADLDLAAARLHSALKRRPDVRSTLRIRSGGHDAQFWSASVVDVVRAAGQEQ